MADEIRKGRADGLERVKELEKLGAEGFREANHSDIGFVARLIHDYIEREVNNDLKPYGLTMTQSRILIFLRSRLGQHTTQKEVEEFLGVSHPTTVGLLKRLEGKGFIRTEVDPADRRMKLVFLTAKDRELGMEMWQNRKKTEALLTEGLSEEEKEELKRLMGIVRENILRRM